MYPRLLVSEVKRSLRASYRCSAAIPWATARLSLPQKEGLPSDYAIGLDYKPVSSRDHILARTPVVYCRGVIVTGKA